MKVLDSDYPPQLLQGPFRLGLQSQEHTMVVWEIPEGFEDASLLILRTFHSGRVFVVYTLIPSILDRVSIAVKSHYDHSNC